MDPKSNYRGGGGRSVFDRDFLPCASQWAELRVREAGFFRTRASQRGEGKAHGRKSNAGRGESEKGH